MQGLQGIRLFGVVQDCGHPLSATKHKNNTKTCWVAVMCASCRLSFFMMWVQEHSECWPEAFLGQVLLPKPYYEPAPVCSSVKAVENTRTHIFFKVFSTNVQRIVNRLLSTYLPRMLHVHSTYFQRMFHVLMHAFS